MWNIIFTVLFSMAAAGLFDNAPIGWEIIISILMSTAAIILMYEDRKQEKLQDQVKSLENKMEQLEKLVGE